MDAVVQALFSLLFKVKAYMLDSEVRTNETLSQNQCKYSND